MSKTKLVPRHDAQNAVIGHIPLRTSKNPVIGVVRCECGEPATVHNPKGNRSGSYYTICDECKTNQSSGQYRQKYLRKHMVQTVEELPEESPGQLSEIEKPAPIVEQPTPIEAAEAPQPEPVKAAEAPAEALPAAAAEAANDAAVTANAPEEKPAADKPVNNLKGLLAAGCFAIGGILALVA